MGRYSTIYSSDITCYKCRIEQICHYPKIGKGGGITLAAIAQEESRSISANIAWSNQKRFPAGNVCNKDIYGYEFRKGEYTVNENGYRCRAVFIIPEEAEIVRMVFRLFTKEELSFTQIAQKLDALHIPPPNSGCRQRQKRKPTVLPAGTLKEEDKRGWTATDVRYMIANVRYCGSVLCQKTYTDHRNGHKQKANKGEKPKYLIRNHHPAIISEELWQEAQEVWKAYTAKYRGIEKGRNERNYSKLLLCGECGRYFQGHSTTRTTIWRCATKLAQQGQKRCRMEPIYAIKRDHEENGENAWIDSEFRMVYQKVQEHVAERDSSRKTELDERILQLEEKMAQMQGRLKEAVERGRQKASPEIDMNT